MSVNIVVFDTETNGLNPLECDLLSLGWIKAKITSKSSFQILEHVEYFVKNDNIHNTELCLLINGITDEFRQQHGKPINEILDLFAQSIKDCEVYAYNYKFDVNFINMYKPDFFQHSHVKLIDDVRNQYQQKYDVPVVCALQKIIYQTFNAFNHWIPIKYHLHTAYDDVYAELLILLYQKFNINISAYCETTSKYEPDITISPHKHIPLSKASPKLIQQLLTTKEPELQYLKQYIQIHEWQ